MRLGARLRQQGDLVAGVVLAGIFCVELVAWDDADLPKAIPFALLTAVGVALRRRTPLAAFLVTVAGFVGAAAFAPGIDNQSLAFTILFFLSLYSLGRHARGVEAWLGAGCVLLGMALFYVGDAVDNASFDVVGVVFAVGFVGAPWGAGLGLRLRREREQTLSAANQKLREEQEEHARRAVAAERARIARELHDVVSHAIAVTVLQARGGRKMVGVDEGEVRHALDAIEHTNIQALGDMRRLLALLRDTEDGVATAPLPSLDRLGELIEDVRASGVPVELTVVGQPDGIPPGVDLSAYRIVQEALTNVAKHAVADAGATVRLEYLPEELRIEVVDDGGGAAAAAAADGPGAGSGQGLVGIRERVAVVGGDVAAGPGPDGGFRLGVRLPYQVES
jgi:signal transduction histidine kinase